MEKKEIEEYNKSVDILIEWSEAYDAGSPIVDNATYDALYQKTKLWEGKNPDKLDPNSPTQKVIGVSTSPFIKVKHTVQMMSLSNLFNEDDVKKWFTDNNAKLLAAGDNKVEYLCEPKWDGLSLNLRYEFGELVHAITRGDGSEGDDVLRNIDLVPSIPTKIEYPETIEIRGELFISDSEYEKYNDWRITRGHEKTKTMRGAAAGAIRNIHDKPNITLSFMVWGIGDNILTYDTMSEIYGFLKDLGFETPDVIIHERLFDINAEIEKIEARKDTEGFEFPIDGVVLKINNIQSYNHLGYTAKAPRFWSSYKFEQVAKITKIKNIIYTAGKHGDITPVAILEPIVMDDGSTVTRATLHNKAEMESLELCENDNILLIKAGEIIPKITGNTGGGNGAKFMFPANCPECGSVLEEQITGTDDIKMVCVSKSCPSKLQKRMENIIGKNGLDIKGFGPKIIESMIDADFLNDTTDIFKLKNHSKELLDLPRFGAKTRDKILQQIDQIIESLTPDRFIYILQIKGIGVTMSKHIPVLFKRFDFDDFGLLSGADLESLDNFGETLAKNWDDYMNNNRKYVFDLIDIIKPINPVDMVLTEKTEETGIKIAITGALSGIKKADLGEIINNTSGLTYQTAIRKDTQLAIIGNRTTKGQKLIEAGADELVTIDELNDFISNNSTYKNEKYIVSADIAVSVFKQAE